MNRDPRGKNVPSRAEQRAQVSMSLAQARGLVFEARDQVESETYGQAIITLDAAIERILSARTALVRMGMR